MLEIRRIRPDEAEAVTELWDQMARSNVDGGPLTTCGRRNITAMLREAAAHAEVFGLVAVEGGQIVGFTVARTSRHPLLPGVAGEIEEFYVTSAARSRGVSRALAEATRARLRSMGAGVVWHYVCREDTVAQGFWQHLGFASDTVRFALYPT
jgi:GNAT superfamily N-acetyltransferase